MKVAEQLGEVFKRDVKAFAIPRAGWPEAFEQFGVPKGHTGPAEEMFEGVNAGWMDLGTAGTQHVAGTTSARDVFAAAQQSRQGERPIRLNGCVAVVSRCAPVKGMRRNGVLSDLHRSPGGRPNHFASKKRRLFI